MPKPPNKLWIVLCPSDEDVKQELRVTLGEQHFSLCSRPQQKEEQTRWASYRTQMGGKKMDLETQDLAKLGAVYSSSS